MPWSALSHVPAEETCRSGPAVGVHSLGGQRRPTSQARLARAEETGQFGLVSRGRLLGNRVDVSRAARRPCKPVLGLAPLGLSNTGDKLRSSEVDQASSASSPCSTAPRSERRPCLLDALLREPVPPCPEGTLRT